jgi:UDP-2-acetamido-3-amino-2,3-dideoxy-glucuronate N-acetyltransferase
MSAPPHPPSFESEAFVHPSSEVDAGASLGQGVKIWHFCHVMPGARLGPGAQLGQGCFIGQGVSVGARARIQNHVSVFEGVTLEDDVFVGPNATFTNVKNPRAHVVRRAEFRRTLVRRGATIGANATILPGIELGEYCFVGAGAVVTHDVPAHALVLGTPARAAGYMSRHGERLAFAEGAAVCPATGERYALTPSGVRLIDARD